jgi:hypothetical protein
MGVRVLNLATRCGTKDERKGSDPGSAPRAGGRSAWLAAIAVHLSF